MFKKAAQLSSFVAALFTLSCTSKLFLVTSAFRLQEHFKSLE